LKILAKKYKVDDRVVFAGRKNSDELFQIIDDSDIYIQPSLQEGLPRSVVEAMSRACPCIGAKTGGIPELIDSKYIVKRKSPDSIVEAVKRLANKEELRSQAEINFVKSKDFLDSLLSQERQSFYKRIKQELTGKI
jgi:glycosyltransferase involved in cell wall biosynthesis